MRVFCPVLGMSLLLSLGFAPAASAQAGSAVAWEVITMDGGASAARATNIGVVQSIVVTCLENKPVVIVKLAPGTATGNTTLGIEWITNRQEAALVRYQATDGWVAFDPPATLLDTMALDGGAVIKIGGKAAGRLPVGNAKRAISQALAPCLASSGAVPAGVGNSPGELRGVRLGMSLAQAQTSLTSAGFPAAHRTASGSEWRAADSRLTQFQPYGRADMEFDSILMAVKRPKPNDWRGDVVVVAMTPPPNAPVVWAVGQGTQYTPGSGPSRASTIASLSQKFGRPSAALPNGSAWYWDSNGRQLGSEVHGTCRRAQHDTYLVNQTNKVLLSGTNLIAIKGDWLAAAVKAGCATSLVADWNSGANDELNYLEIKLVDLLNGNLAAQRTFAFAKSKSNNEANAARQKADTRRPEF